MSGMAHLGPCRLRAKAARSDAVVPERLIGAGDRSHCLGLIDRAEQCPPYRWIIERRMQMVEAQDAHGCRILRKTVISRSPASALARSGSGFSHQPISPLRSAAIAEKGSNVSHSTRSKRANFGPEVKPTGPPGRG
jgi:hypothetical protein